MIPWGIPDLNQIQAAHDEHMTGQRQTHARILKLHQASHGLQQAIRGLQMERKLSQPPDLGHGTMRNPLGLLGKL
jgi:hypothetical protein